MKKSHLILLALMLGLVACDSKPPPNEDPNESVDEGTVDDIGEESEEQGEGLLPDVGDTVNRVGPVGSDNGTKSACTGTTGSGVAIVCVDTALGSASGPGTAAAPYKTISQAITAAKAGDTIQIAQGTYAENPAIGSFNSFSSKRLNILGGFQSGSSFAVRDQGTYTTLLDNALAGVGLRLHVGAGSNNMTVDGLAIRRGKGLGTAWNNGYGHGGGIYVQWTGTGVLTISHVEVYDCQTNSIAANSQQGGGLWATTTANGATTGRVKIQDSYLHDNKAGKGAGLATAGNVDLYRNRIENNIGQNDHGGGMYLTLNSGAAVEDNLIKNNTIGAAITWGWGGGAILLGSANFKNNVWTENFAPSIGSGLFIDEGAVAYVTGDLFFKNDCTNDAREGTALYVDGQGSSGPGSTAYLTNVTVADHICANTGTTGAALFLERASTVVIKNSVFWNNSRDAKGDTGTTITATYSTITGITGTGNLTSNPQFVNSTLNDYHLKSTAGHFTTSGWVTDATTSPAIDAGDPASAFTNEPAPNGSRINQGFEGNTAEASKSATLDYEACPGQPYTITVNAAPTVLSGNLSTSANDEAACSTTSNDRVYRLNLNTTGGILHVSTDNGTLGVRTACTSGVGETCTTDTTFQATASTYYVIVEGTGSFNLTVDYDASVCGDGFVASGEECEPPSTGFCDASCQSTAPDPAAESCPGKGFSIPAGESSLTATTNDLTTINYADDIQPSCAPMTGGQDYVLSVTPAITGTLTVRVGYDAMAALICDSDTCSAYCWDAVLSARTTCSNAGTEIGCENDTSGGEELVIPVTASTPVAIIVDGVNSGHYAKGPFDLQFDLVP